MASSRYSTGTDRLSFPFSRSEEHTSELQSLTNVVCRLLLEKNNVVQPGGVRPPRRPQPDEIWLDNRRQLDLPRHAGHPAAHIRDALRARAHPLHRLAHSTAG